MKTETSQRHTKPHPLDSPYPKPIKKEPITPISHRMLETPKKTTTNVESSKDYTKIFDSSNSDGFKSPKTKVLDSPAYSRFHKSPSRPTLSRSSTWTTELGDVPWTRKDWKTLESYYVRNDRDYNKAGVSFYYMESLTLLDGNQMTERWSKEHIVWRCRCLDTHVKMHGGQLPSERKKKKDVVVDEKN